MDSESSVKAIDLVPGADLPNLPLCRMNPIEYLELPKPVDEPLRKEFIRESLIPCTIPALLTPKEDNTWKNSIDNRAMTKVIVECRFSIPRLDGILDMMVSATIFSRIDFKSGNHQVMIRPRDD